MLLFLFVCLFFIYFFVCFGVSLSTCIIGELYLLYCNVFIGLDCIHCVSTVLYCIFP